MKLFKERVLMTLVLAAGFPLGLAAETETTTPAAESGFDTLLGLWVRPDGGYQVAIRAVDGDGNIDAMYANPQALPFAKAKAYRKDDRIEVFLELRAGGYNGSTYTLTYDPDKDILRGVYYQAVARQNFGVYFERAR